VRPSDDLVPLPAGGRLFEHTVIAGLADAAPGGRVRLDALARWLQDIAHADIREAGIAERAVWVVRRTRLQIQRFPRFDEPARLTTFVSGLGRAWAQRRTTVGTAGGGLVEAVMLWVHLDPRTGRPCPMDDDELAVYLSAVDGREIKARLHHPAPPPDAVARPWLFRAGELDLADHINNAAYWVPFEEELLAGEEPMVLDVELEYRGPAQPGPHLVLADGRRRWIVTPEREVIASLLLDA
jgi:acyl-ACP thioesterase